MNFALINTDSKVENIIIADQDFADSLKSDWLDVINTADHEGVNIGDTWDGTTFTKPTPDYELQWKLIRAQRAQKLQESDWTQLADVPLSDDDRAAWATYRQALRDITNQDDPFAITWPIAPGS